MHDFEFDQSDKYCIFQCCHETLGIEAAWIRNVTNRPELSDVPFADRTLSGLAYIHKEFLPVFDLSHLINASHRGSQTSGEQTLVVSSDRGPWGILIDQVLGLDSLEISFNGARDDNDGWASVNVGTASYRDQFVSIVDPQGLYRIIDERLETCWQIFDDELERSEPTAEGPDNTDPLNSEPVDDDQLAAAEQANPNS